VHLVQYFEQALVTQAGLQTGVNELAAQTAQLHIRLLRQEEDIFDRWLADHARARAPQTRDGAQQRTFATAAVTGDQQPIPRLQCQRQLLHQHAFVLGRIQRDRIQREMITHFGLNQWMLVVGCFGLRVGVGQHQFRQGLQPVYACHKPAQALEVVDNQRDRTEHRDKRTGRLHRPADFHLARQHRIGQNHAGQYDGQLVEAALKDIERALLLDESCEIGEHLAKFAVDLCALLRLTAVERDGLRVLPQAHQSEAEVRFAPQLPEVQLDQRLAKKVERDEGAHQRVHRQHPHQQMRDRPQHRAEGHQLHQRAQEYQQEVDRPAGEGVDVFADALVRVVDLTHGAQRVVFAVAQIAVQKAASEPAPPLVGERVAHVVVERVDRHRKRQNAQARVHRIPEPVGLPARECRRHFTALVVEHHGKFRLGQHQDNQQRQQCPCGFLLVAQPVGLGHMDKLLPGCHREGGRTPPRCDGSVIRWGSGCGVVHGGAFNVSFGSKRAYAVSIRHSRRVCGQAGSVRSLYRNSSGIASNTATAP